MAKIKNDTDFLKEMRERFENSETRERNNREAAKEDFSFTFNMGEEGQWPSNIRAEREAEGRPCLTTNLLAKFTNRMVGEQRQNRPRIKVRPVDSDSDPKLASVLNDIIRNIENISVAGTAYDTAYLHALAGGFGYFRILTQFTNDDSFDQEILIKRILNPFTVYLDQTAVEFDYSDIRYGFIIEDVIRKAFKKEYPKAAPVSFEEANNNDTSNSSWFTEDTIRVAEYYWKEDIKRTIVQVTDQLGIPSVIELKNGIEKEDLIEQGFTIHNEREVDTHKVMWAKITSTEILEGPTEQNGRYIPIVPVLGQEIYIDGERRYRSLIRDAKDPQRSYNYHMSVSSEQLALTPKAPYHITAEQIKGHEPMWRNANKKNLPYLIYNNEQGTPPPQRQTPPTISTGHVQEAAIAKQNLEDTMGVFSAALGKPSNERSKVAIDARRAQSNVITFSFVDNLRRAIIYAGRILVDLIPRVYDTQRIIRITGEDGQEELMEINKLVFDYDTRDWVLINDLSLGKYDVEIDVGIDYSTKRQEIFDQLIQFMQYAPDIAPYILDLVAKNMDMPDSGELIKRLEKLLPPGLLPGTEQQQPGVAATEGGPLPVGPTG